MEVANRLLGHQPNSRESDEAFDPEPRPSEEEPDKDYENNMVIGQESNIVRGFIYLHFSGLQ